jgi:ketosteroid isomerase-like protein
MSNGAEDTIKNIFEVELPGYVREGDVAGYMTLWSDNCMWCPPDRPDQTGKAEIEAGVTALLNEYTIDPTFQADEVKVVEQYGFVNGTSHELVTPKAGGPQTVVDTREFWLFVDESDGWKITRLIFNHKPTS